MTRNLLSEGCSKRFKSEDEWFPREINLSLPTGLAVLFIGFGAVCLVLLLFGLRVVAPSWPETHSQVAQADLCILCTHGGSIRAKKIAQPYLDSLLFTVTHVSRSSRCAFRLCRLAKPDWWRSACRDCVLVVSLDMW